ncbi:MAG TPA: 3-hydroxyanthranilate 3,4-dioxygenase, partial [Acidobacteriota bacterium]|nr:3-hydroxyanthranilate 3,4-dioxygenase [Acidobacteriota bacterium]
AVLKAGDIFLLPKNMPHSPRRAEGSWTYVVERVRREEEIDRFIWPCEKCGNTLYETEIRFDDPGDAVNKATESLRADPALATCKMCGDVLVL